METNRENLQYTPIDGKTSDTVVEPKPKRTYLYVSVAILNIAFIMCGTSFGWSSPVLMKLELHDNEASTVASALPLGIVLGPFVSGALLDRIGRKATVGLGMGFMTGCYLILTVVQSVSLLSVGRFMAGINCGVAFSIVPLYIAEISEDSLRGFLNTMNQISISSGSLLMYAVGPFVSYAVLHYILLSLCAIFFLLFPILSDSPYSFVMKNDLKGAKQILMKLRGDVSESMVDHELQVIQKANAESQEGSKSIKELFTLKGNRKALTICMVLLASQQISGVSILFLYLEQIFEMTGTTLSSSTCSIIIGFIFLGSGFITPVAVKYFGYKTPLLASTSGMTLGMGGLGVYFFVKFLKVDLGSLNWLPLLSVVLYITSFNVGFANIPWALAGELFPNNIKSGAVTLIASTSGFLAFLTVKLFPLLISLLGLHTLFSLCSLSCFLTVVFTALVVSDTSSMSFLEIQQMLNGNKRIDLSLNKPLKSSVADVEL